LPSFVWRLASDIGLDHIEFGDPAQRLGGQRRCPRRVQIVEFSPRVRSAGGFLNRAVFE
jgi:hypothetical protein